MPGAEDEDAAAPNEKGAAAAVPLAPDEEAAAPNEKAGAADVGGADSVEPAAPKLKPGEEAAPEAAAPKLNFTGAPEPKAEGAAEGVEKLNPAVSAFAALCGGRAPKAKETGAVVVAVRAAPSGCPSLEDAGGVCTAAAPSRGEAAELPRPALGGDNVWQAAVALGTPADAFSISLAAAAVATDWEALLACRKAVPQPELAGALAASFAPAAAADDGGAPNENVASADLVCVDWRAISSCTAVAAAFTAAAFAARKAAPHPPPAEAAGGEGDACGLPPASAAASEPPVASEAAGGDCCCSTAEAGAKLGEPLRAGSAAGPSLAPSSAGVSSGFSLPSGEPSSSTSSSSGRGTAAASFSRLVASICSSADGNLTSPLTEACDARLGPLKSNTGGASPRGTRPLVTALTALSSGASRELPKLKTGDWLPNGAGMDALSGDAAIGVSGATALRPESAPGPFVSPIANETLCLGPWEPSASDALIAGFRVETRGAAAVTAGAQLPPCGGLLCGISGEGVPAAADPGVRPSADALPPGGCGFAPKLNSPGGLLPAFTPVPAESLPWPPNENPSPPPLSTCLDPSVLVSPACS
mmetsp:Transcript_28219/g.67019  ORF Transcript_28219/g.67019 Transcript_28219/m.67019 type:complete len:587 (-) Transcript_28219:1786-3546(-)